MEYNQATVLIDADGEERVTPRVAVEQAVRVLCVIGFLLTVFIPLIICDVLGSVAPIYTAETGIPLDAPEVSSQTRFFYGLIYMLQRSGQVFIPLRVFEVGAQWIISSTGGGATFLGVIALICMALLYILPVYLFVVLKVSRYVHTVAMDKVREISVFVCGALYLVITAVLAFFVFGLLWNFYWEYDSHYEFAQQFFLAYGGLKMALSLIVSFLIFAGCTALAVFYKKAIR